MSNETLTGMREALEAVKVAFDSGTIGPVGNYPPARLVAKAGRVMEKVEKALAAPPEPPPNIAAMREALEYVLQFDATDDAAEQDGLTDAERIAEYADHIEECQKKARSVLASQPHKGRWRNGRSYEYEYAYCSECGRMQWAGWDSHRQAKENIGSFADDYRFCPWCGAEMEGGEYVR